MPSGGRRVWTDRAERDAIKSTKMSRSWYLIVLTILSQVPKATAKPFKLYIGSFFGVDIKKDGAWSSAGVIPAVEMALEHVNNDNSILAGYTLDYIWRDSKASDLAFFIKKSGRKVNSSAEEAIF